MTKLMLLEHQHPDPVSVPPPWLGSLRQERPLRRPVPRSRSPAVPSCPPAAPHIWAKLPHRACVRDGAAGPGCVSGSLFCISL